MEAINYSDEKMHMDSNFSQNEARVLHSLVKWPNMTDQAIHSQIGMKKSTFSSIKTRLKEHNYFNRYFVPNFPLIGFELFMVMHGNLNRFTTYEERMRIAKDTIESFTEDFYVLSEANQAFNLSISQNLTEYEKNQEKFLQLYLDNKFLSKRGMLVCSYPFEITRVHSFMDYEGIVSKIFGFAGETYEGRKIIPSGPINKIKLTRAEKKVLIGLVEHPEESDTFIADNIGVSRNTVANAKRKFLSKGICFPRVVPNLQKLGLEYINFSYRKFNTRITDKERQSAVDIVRKTSAPFFYISKNLDSFMISAHQNERDLDDANDELMRFYMKHEYLNEDPVNYKLKISEMNVIKDYDFLPMTLKILDMSDLKR